MAKILTIKSGSNGQTIELGVFHPEVWRQFSITSPRGSSIKLPRNTDIADGNRDEKPLRRNSVIGQFFLQIAQWDQKQRASGNSNPTFCLSMFTWGNQEGLPEPRSKTGRMMMLKQKGLVELISTRDWKITEEGLKVAKEILPK